MSDEYSIATAETWRDPEVAAKRSVKHGLMVDGHVYSSAKQAFRHLGIKANHIPWRIKFKDYVNREAGVLVKGYPMPDGSWRDLMLVDRNGEGATVVKTIAGPTREKSAEPDCPVTDGAQKYDEILEHDFNLMVDAFRRMKGSLRFRRDALNSAIKNLNWRGWDKEGITEDALAIVRENIAAGDSNWFRGCESAHRVARRTYCENLLTEEHDSYYAYFRQVSRCVISTRAENRVSEGWEHFSTIYPVNPDMFRITVGSIKVFKSHDDFPTFMALVNGEGGASLS